MAGLGKKLIPLFDRVLIEKFVAQTKSKGGIMIPEKAMSKILSGTVVSVGPGAKNEKGDLVPVAVKEGDQVLLPEYGGTKIEIDDKEFFIFRDNELLGKWIN